MAFYDNRHWLLSHIRNSFISGDDTGMSEIVLTGQNLCRTIADQNKYPGIEETDDEEDDSSHSIDNYSDLEFGMRRQRSNTAVRLEKMEKEKKEAASITRIKWENPRPFSAISEEDKQDMFSFKPIEKTSPQSKISSLTQQLQKCSFQYHNPFREYVKFDGHAQVGTPVRKYGILLTMMRPEHSNYPMYVCVISSAKVSDLIGFILWKCSVEYPEYPLKEDVNYYGLHIAEDDGEIDWVFPCLDPKESVSKFVFKLLALVERSSDEIDSQTPTQEKVKFSFSMKDQDNDSTSREIVNKEELNPLQDQMSAIDALLYKSYKVLLLSKVRSKVEVNLGISGEKLDIDPVLKQNNNTKFFSKRKPSSYDIDFIVACNLTETKSNNRAVFRLVYDKSSSTDNTQNSSYPEILSWNNFKHYDFESKQPIAEEIVQKINHILELRCSLRRKEYLSMRENKSHRRRSFHLGPR